MAEEQKITLRDQPVDREIDVVLDIQIICRMNKETAEYVGTHNPDDRILNEEPDTKKEGVGAR